MSVLPILVFLIFFYFYLYGSGSNERVYHSNFIKYDPYYFYRHANFYLSILIFSTHQHLSSLWNMHQNSNRSLIWYIMSQHEYK